MGPKIIYYIRQYIDILKWLVILMIIFYHGNLKDCLMKVLNLLLHPMFLIFCYYVGTKTSVEFEINYLKQDKISFDHGKIEYIYIAYEINKDFDISNYPTLESCLFGAYNLKKHPDIDQYKFSGYDTGVDRNGPFSLRNEIGRNLIIFRVNMSSSLYIDNKKKYVLILGKGPTQGLEHTLTV